jgi:CxxC motif-containing protein (DUF1111 family)
VETAADGLGPTFNAQSCRECHQNVVTGGASQIAEHRTGRLNGDAFFGSLGDTLGAGFVEAIANRTLLELRDRQPVEMRGTALDVPVLEGDGSARAAASAGSASTRACTRSPPTRT